MRPSEINIVFSLVSKDEVEKGKALGDIVNHFLDDNRIAIHMEGVSTTALKGITTIANAKSAVTLLDAALQTINSKRSSFSHYS